MKKWILRFLAVVLVVAVAVWVYSWRRQLVEREKLAKLIDGSDRLVVRQTPRDKSAILFESSDRSDLDALKRSLRVELPWGGIHCMCDGTPAIYLYSNGRQIGQITNHHAKLIRCSLWESDAHLVDTESLLNWFDERNIPGPRQEYEHGMLRDQEWQDDERKWEQGMPAALRPLWPAARHSFDPDLAPLRKALEKEIPDETARIRALFSWYGSGAGPWSGFPSYEDVAEGMLLDYSTVALLAVAERNDLTEVETEGIARLFGGWTFSRARPDDLRLLSAELKARLLKHSLATTNEDKRGRAQRAFGVD